MMLFVQSIIYICGVFFPMTACIKQKDQYFKMVMIDNEDSFGFRILTFNKFRSSIGCINMCMWVNCTIVAIRQIDKQTDCLCLENLDIPTAVSNGDIWTYDNTWNLYAKDDTLISVLGLRAARGTKEAVFATWNNSSYVNYVTYKDVVLADAEINETFRNPLINNWLKWNIHTVQLILLTNGTEQIRMVFDGGNTSNRTWFSLERLMLSPWTGLTPEGFRIHVTPDKSFLIKSFHIGCIMGGWLMVLEVPDPCDWVGSSLYPQFLYSPVSTSATFSASGDRLLADVFMISVTLRIS